MSNTGTLFFLLSTLISSVAAADVPYAPPIISPNIEEASQEPVLIPGVDEVATPKVNKLCGTVKDVVRMGKASIRLQVVSIDKVTLKTIEQHYRVPYSKRHLLAGIDFKSQQTKKNYCLESTSAVFTVDSPGNLIRIYLQP